MHNMTVFCPRDLKIPFYVWLTSALDPVSLASFHPPPVFLFVGYGLVGS